MNKKTVIVLLVVIFSCCITHGKEPLKEPTKPINIRKWLITLNGASEAMPSVYSNVQEKSLIDERIKKLHSEVKGLKVELLWKVKEVIWQNGVAKILAFGPKGFSPKMKFKHLSVKAESQLHFLMSEEEARQIKVGQVINMTATTDFYEKQRLHAKFYNAKAQPLFRVEQHYHYSGKRYKKIAILGTVVSDKYSCVIGDKKLNGRWEKAPQKISAE